MEIVGSETNYHHPNIFKLKKINKAYLFGQSLAISRRCHLKIKGFKNTIILVPRKTITITPSFHANYKCQVRLVMLESGETGVDR